MTCIQAELSHSTEEFTGSGAKTKFKSQYGSDQ